VACLKILIIICKGIRNFFIIKSARIVVGIAVLISVIALMALKEASWTKSALVFLTTPFSLFIVGHFKKSGEVAKYDQDFNQNFNQDYYKEEDETPVIDRIEKRTTTTTTETIYFKKGIKYLE
jgi:hypothetical protein